MGAESIRSISQEDQPVEEPWLLHSSSFFIVPKKKMGSDEIKRKEAMQDEVHLPQFPNQQLMDVENLLPEEGASQIFMDDSISTVILINSSICTMQRIAVLEDGKLVELLLEPVKNNVQCDSVYLGVVTKLVPHMGGAFVNIGNSRPSLMDINHNREPFIFPPFHHRTKEKEIDNSVFGANRKQPGAYENECSSHEDIDVIDDIIEVDFQDDPLQFENDDFEEHEVENDFCIPEVLKENVNGGILNRAGVEADFEDYIDGAEQRLEGDAINNSCYVETCGLNDYQVKVSRHATINKKWAEVKKGTKIIVQVVKEGLGKKGPTLTAYPKLRSRFWILITRCNRVGISKKISGAERTRLRVVAKTLQPPGFGLTVRTVAAGHSLEELQKDLEGLLSTWKNITEHAKSAALAADEGVEGAIPVILHRAMGQTLSIVQDYFNEKVMRMVVDSPRTYHEVTNYLQEIAPDLCDRVELYKKRIPLFDAFNVEEEINNILNKRVSLANGGSLVIEQTEALVSIDVNGGHGMFGRGISQEKAILDVNLAAANQIARELRLRDIGGIIVVDFIDMMDDSNKRLVYEEVKKAVERDRSMVKVSELSKHGLMEITRKRVRPSVTFMISEPCACCHATGRVEALETSFSKIEHEICRFLAMMDKKPEPENPKSWPRFILRVDHYMCNHLTSGKKTRLATLSSSLKVWILLKVARGFTRGAFEVKPITDDKVNGNRHQVPISMLQSAEAGTYNPSRKVTLFPVKKSKTHER
ncbi:ribonuclease E/G-like protein, chloroplastic isoform X2 [Malania oleifera]|nr:ribonuclease E/G-like protein, chloroplastic isoform X2 [Malania oleifera]